MQTEGDGLVVRPAERDTTPGLRGGVRTRLARAAETGGAYSLSESTSLPGAGAPPHIHHECEEAFYILEGQLRFRLDEREVTVPAGSFVLVPRGTPHAFTNAGAATARYLVIFSPARGGAYFDDLADLAAASPDAPLSGDTIAAVARTYGAEYLT